MKRKIITICAASVAFLLALGIMLYPLISSAYNEKHHAYLLEDYSMQIEQTDDAELIAARELAAAYNQSLQPGVQMADAFSKEALLAASEEYWDLLDMNGSGIMGYIEIPAIDVHLPIYHGTEDATLQKGVGHLMGSSLPLGGESTHTILTGHSGMASQRMFTDLPQLNSGDIFYLHIYGEVLAYQVYFTDEVFPYDTNLLQIQKGKDLCTLVTCTPIGVNTYRLLVMAERIPYEEAGTMAEVRTAESSESSAWEQNYLKGILLGTGGALFIAVLVLAAWLFRKVTKRTVRIMIICLMALLFLVGSGILAYPSIHGAWVDKAMEEQASNFLDMIGEQESAPSNEHSNITSNTDATATNHTELWYEMQNYNGNLWVEKQAGLSDPWSYEQPSFSLGDFGLDDEVFGVLSIPAIDLSIPIYLGATDAHLASGAAQLSQTSIPIGGSNTNTVIAGHRGWNGADFFRYVPDLQVGNTVTITNLWEELNYVVVDKDIIEPHEVEKVLIQEGKDMLTLLTCHPYASGGKQRYLVLCERITEGQDSSQTN